MEKMTDREQDVFNFIVSYHDQHGYSPSWDEIKKGIYVQSNTAVQRHIIRLCEKGYLKFTPYVSRSIVINIKL